MSTLSDEVKQLIGKGNLLKPPDLCADSSCRLCDSTAYAFVETKLKDHALNHLSRKVNQFGLVFVPCRLLCLRKNIQYHFHCSRCQTTLGRKAYFENHSRTHCKQSSYASPGEEVITSLQTEAELEPESVPPLPESVPPLPATLQHSPTAPPLPSLAQRPRQFTKPLRAQRIDPVNEIFLVQRSHAGQHIPIHCQVKTFTTITNCNTVCEDPLCITADRGIFSYQCEHTISTHYSQLIPNVPQFILQQCLTSELMTTGKKSRLSKLNENFPNIPLIVVYEFKEDMLTNVDRYLYFSVLEPGPTSY